MNEEVGMCRYRRRRTVYRIQQKQKPMPLSTEALKLRDLEMRARPGSKLSRKVERIEKGVRDNNDWDSESWIPAAGSGT